MLHFIFFIFFVSFYSSCSSFRPTPYKIEKDNYGYSDRVVQQERGELKIATFKGNNRTNKILAKKYALFRAMEICDEDNKKHVNILDIFDRSFEKETQSYDGVWPDWFYGFGSFPYYSQHSSIGIGARVHVLNRRSVKDFIFYPWFEIYFICSDQIKSPLLQLRDVPPQEMYHLVKDLRGGVQVINTKIENSTSLQKNDIIIKFQKKRIERRYLLLWDLQKTEGDVILLRDGRELEKSLSTFDLTKVVSERENDLRAELCSHKKFKLKDRKICKE